MIPEEDLEDGGLRMLEVDNRVILPEQTHVRLVITSSDVIHSFAKKKISLGNWIYCAIKRQTPGTS